MIWKITACAACLIAAYVLFILLDFIRKLCQSPKLNDLKHFTDEEGRIVIYHGVNVCNYSKYSPDYLPWHQEEDYARLPKWGFNVVRFVVFWDAIEPKKGFFDLEYLSKVADHVKLIGKYGVKVVLDLHQDVFSKKFNGDGFPPWAIDDDGKPFKNQKRWELNYLQPAVRAAAKNFWRNPNVKIQYIKALTVLAQHVGTLNNVIGIDIINEPFPPLPWIRKFEKSTLSDFYRMAVAGAASVGFDKPLFYEPCVFTSTGLPTYLDFKTTLGKTVYFPHYYPPLSEPRKKYGPFDQFFFKHSYRIKAAEAQKFDSPLAFGEMGISATVKGYLSYVNDFIELGEKYHASWVWWSYEKEGCDDHCIIDSNKNERDVLKVLSHIYPQKIAGKNPTYRSRDGEFYLTYDSIETTAPTVVYVPSNVLYVIDSNCRYEVVENAVLFYNDKVKNPVIRIFHKE